MRVRWYGQSAFHLVPSGGGDGVFVDPFGRIEARTAGQGFRFGYPPIQGVRAQLLLVTHEHFDHNGVDAIAGSPHTVRSLAGTFETPLGPVVGVASEHDPEAGTRRGANVVFVFTVDGIRCCHFGDFGQAALRPEQVRAIGSVDLLFVPVGGGPTIGSEGARAVVEALRPRWVVPMHYRTEAASFLPEGVEGFTRHYRDVWHGKDSAFDTEALPTSAGGPLVVVPAVPRP
jgi:L-ascorbate metabolism protein UlaG (beta-lactamase superfamily)